MLLEEVKDIRDELQMLSIIFERQEYVRQGIKETIGAIGRQRSWTSGAVQKPARVLEDHKRTITRPLRDIGRIDRQAERVYASVRDLLDVKQKYVGVIATRYAKEQAEEGPPGGKTLMIFTTVTTIFLPLSFITTFFTISIKELQDREGDQVLALLFVLK